jgi:hypothetical protein
LVVIGSNRPRLYATMLAAQSLGAIPIPLYQDAAAPECVFPLNNAEVRFAVVEDQEQVDKLLEIREQCPQIAHIFFDDPRGLRKYDEPGLASLEELLAAGAVFAKQHPDFYLDEVEKAHLDVVNLFYQVFDKGILSDGEGREINFRNTVVFLTSILALDVITELCSGDERPDPSVVMAAVRPILSNHFKPALLARMTVIPFYTLPKDALRGIVDLKLKKVINRMAANNKIALEITTPAREAVTARCTEVETGARNIDFILKGTVLPLLSNSLLESMAKNTNPSKAKLDVDAAGEFVATFS